jgi:hypothetical protein
MKSELLCEFYYKTTQASSEFLFYGMMSHDLKLHHVTNTRNNMIIMVELTISATSKIRSIHCVKNA